MRRPLLALAVLASAAAVGLFAACVPPRTVPAVGTMLTASSCGVTSHGISLWQMDARCPDLMRVERVASRVSEAYPGCSLDGARVFVVNAYVLCGDEETVDGCRVGSDITIRSGGGVVATIEHELRHVCHGQMEQPGLYDDPDASHRHRIRNTILL